MAQAWIMKKIVSVNGVLEYHCPECQQKILIHTSSLMSGRRVECDCGTELIFPKTKSIDWNIVWDEEDKDDEQMTLGQDDASQIIKTLTSLGYKASIVRPLVKERLDNGDRNPEQIISIIRKKILSEKEKDAIIAIMQQFQYSEKESRARLDWALSIGHTTPQSILRFLVGDETLYASYLIKLDSKNYNLLCTKGYSLRQQYRFADAEEVFILALEVKPGNICAISHLVYLKRCQGKIDEALTLCESISLLDNEGDAKFDFNGDANGYTFFDYIDILILLNRIDEAMELLRQAIEKYPDQKASYALLAELYEERNEPELAKKYYESGLEKPFAKLWEPEECYGLFHGVILAGLGDHEAAISWILENQGKVEKAKPYNWYDYWLARSYFALGQIEEARKHADRAIQYLTITNDWQSRIRYCRELLGKLATD